MVVNTTGDVGIGTTSPTSNLTVSGAIRVVSGDSSNVAYWLPPNLAIRSGTATGTNYLDLGTVFIRGGGAQE